MYRGNCNAICIYIHELSLNKTLYQLCLHLIILPEVWKIKYLTWLRDRESYFVFSHRWFSSSTTIKNEQNTVPPSYLCGILWIFCLFVNCSQYNHTITQRHGPHCQICVHHLIHIHEWRNPNIKAGALNHCSSIETSPWGNYIGYLHVLRFSFKEMALFDQLSPCLRVIPLCSPPSKLKFPPQHRRDIYMLATHTYILSRNSNILEIKRYILAINIYILATK